MSFQFCDKITKFSTNDHRFLSQNAKTAYKTFLFSELMWTDPLKLVLQSSPSVKCWESRACLLIVTVSIFTFLPFYFQRCYGDTVIRR